MSCHLGDFVEYASIRRGLSDREKQLARDDSSTSRRAEVAQALERLELGDVIRLPGGGRRSSRIGVVIERGTPERASKGRGPSCSPRTARCASSPPATSSTRPHPIERLRLPKGFRSRDTQARKTLAARLREIEAPAASAKPPWLRRRGRDADGTACPAARASVPQLQRARGPRALGRALAPAAPRDPGPATSGQRPHRQHRPHLRPCRRGARRDRLPRRRHRHRRRRTADPALHRDGPRGGRGAPSGPVARAHAGRAGRRRVGRSSTRRAATSARHRRLPVAQGVPRSRRPCGWPDDLSALERDHRLSAIRDPDAGFAWAAYRWASGHRLEAVLTESDLAAGDFVRWCKQLIDLLGTGGQRRSDERGRRGRRCDRCCTHRDRLRCAAASWR